MSTTIETVAIAGATGNLGPAIVKALLFAGFRVTALTRHGSTSTHALPKDVVSTPVDYASVSELTAALRGQDALVSNLNPDQVDQIPLLQAALDAGVKRILPSEFGMDCNHPSYTLNPFFGPKVKVMQWLRLQIDNGKNNVTSYTFLCTSAFLDWCLEKTDLLINPFPNGVTEVFNGGDRQFSVTTVQDVGRAVAGMLLHPEETKNRTVLVHSAAVTQNQLLRWADETTGVNRETKEAVVEDVFARGKEKVGKGDMSGMYDCLKYAVFGGVDVGAKFNVDNELLGIETLSEKELKDLVGKHVKA